MKPFLLGLRTGLILLCWFTLLVGSTPASADGGYEVQVVQVQTNAYPDITVYVEVTDTTGQVVTELQQTNFAITEDGQSVNIVDFAGVGQERPVDIVFVFDTTGSMGEEIEGVKETCIRFAQELEAKGRDYRLGLVTFWDEVQGVYGSGGRLTDDVQEFRGWIETISTMTGAGGDEPENSFGALKEASRMSFRPEAQRVFILITDAPAHYYGDEGLFWGTYDDPDLDLDRILNILNQQTVTVYSVAYNHPDFRRLADETGGKFYDINYESDFTGIIEEIGGSIATQYRLTYHSPRPTYDGTRRDIRVEVGGGATGSSGSANSAYLEQHLLNIQSDPRVGAVYLLPLLLFLVAPTGLRLVRKLRPSASPPPLPSFFTCPHCGHSVRSGAKFCNGCGRSILEAPSLPTSSTCPNCGRAMRPEAKFCGRCGYRKG